MTVLETERDEALESLESLREELASATSRAEDAENSLLELQEAASSAETAEAEAASEEGLSSTFGDGTWVVGEDIEPGTYRSEGGDYCYWERLSGLSGEFDDIIANELTEGQAVVQISESDVAFKSQDCGTWTRQ